MIDDDEAHISTDDDPNLMERIKILNKQLIYYYYNPLEQRKSILLESEDKIVKILKN